MQPNRDNLLRSALIDLVMCDEVTKIIKCPRCGSEDIHTESNPSLQVSSVNCPDCAFYFQAPITEERIKKLLWHISIDDCAELDA